MNSTLSLMNISVSALFAMEKTVKMGKSGCKCACGLWGYTSNVLRTLPWMTKVKSNNAHSVFPTIVFAIIFMY